MNPQRILIHAAAIADGTGLLIAPGAVLVDGDRILAAGRPREIGEPQDALVRHWPDSLIIPALVNVHAHLDLTHIGPVDYNGEFTGWVDRLRADRARSPEGIADSVREGVRLSRAGGTALVGDIAGVRSSVPTQALRDQGLGGVSFLEVFGVGRSQQAAIETMRAAVKQTLALERGVRFGLQPHAPYSCGPEVYRAAAQLSATRLPLSTHLAETPEELSFVDRADGALADLLRRLGVWDDTIGGFGRHAVDHVIDLWPSRTFVAAHLNYIDDRHLEMMSHARTTVAYCPRASTYFGHGGHRYQDMLAAGINVALGTDSILCLGTADRISVLDDMRLLFRRDGVDPHTLLRMATINGASALGARESLFRIEPGPSAGLLALRVSEHAGDPLTGALLDDAAPAWALGPVLARDEWFEPA